MTFIFYEGFGISVIVVTVIDFERTSLPKPTVALHDIYFHHPPARDDQDQKLIYVHYGDPYVNENLESLVEGLEVDNIPPKGPSSPPTIYSLDEGYVFEHTMLGKPRNDHNLLYHIVLPEYCYIQRNRFDNRTQDDIIIVTRTHRQTIDCIFREGKDLSKTIYFIGPNRSEFNRIRIKFPKYYLKPNSRFPDA